MRLARIGFQRGRLVSVQHFFSHPCKDTLRSTPKLHRDICITFASSEITATAPLPKEEGNIKRVGARAVFDMPVIKDTIELTDVEQGLFDDLLETLKEVGIASKCLLTFRAEHTK